NSILALVLRRVGLPLALTAAAVGFAVFVARIEPLSEWLAVRYAGYWLATALFVAACLSSGHALVRRILGGRALPVLEPLVVASAAGVSLFFLGSLLGGLLGLYGRAFFFALPIALIAVGARSSFRLARRAILHLRGASRRFPRPSPWGFVVHAL